MPVPMLKIRHFDKLMPPRSFRRFFVIGGINTLIGIGSFPLLYTLLHTFIGVNFLLVLSWLVSTAFAFLLHKLVTFQSGGAYHREAVKFFILSLIILGINLTVMNLALPISTTHPVTVQFFTSIVVTLCLMLLNFFGMGRFIFRG